MPDERIQKRDERCGKNLSRREGLREKMRDPYERRWTREEILWTRRDAKRLELRSWRRGGNRQRSPRGQKRDTMRDERAEKRWPRAGMMPERIMERSAEREEHTGLHHNTHLIRGKGDARRATGEMRNEKRATQRNNNEARAAISDNRNPRNDIRATIRAACVGEVREGTGTSEGRGRIINLIRCNFNGRRGQRVE